AELGRGVAESLRILLAHERRELEQARRLQEPRTRLCDRREGGVRPERLLHVHDQERGAIASEQAHRAVITAVRSRWAIDPAATVRSTRPCSRRPAKQQFSERLSQPRSPAIQAASRSTSTMFAGSPGAIAALGSSNSPAPAVIRSTS